MTGRLLVCQPDAEVAKHTHAIVKLASGKELRFVDPRRFGRLSVAHGFEAGGSEPLEVQLDQFVSLFQGPQDADQERPSESETPAGSGQHLRR